MTLTLPEALPAGNELRFELYSQLEEATIFIHAADDTGSELITDSMANNVLTFLPGETTKPFKITQTSNVATGLYVVFENKKKLSWVAHIIFPIATRFILQKQ